MESQSQVEIHAADRLAQTFDSVKSGFKKIVTTVRSNKTESFTMGIGLIAMFLGMRDLQNPDLFTKAALTYSIGITMAIWGATMLMNSQNNVTQKKVLDALARIEEKLGTLSESQENKE